MNGDSLCPPPPADPAATSPAQQQALAGHDFWGWFMFHTGAYAPHRLRFVSLLRLQPAPEAALEAAVRSAGAACARCADGEVAWDVVAVHLRLGEGYSALGAQQERGEGTGSGGSTGGDAKWESTSEAGGGEDPRALAPAGAEDEAEEAAGSCGPRDDAPAVPGGVGLGVCYPPPSPTHPSHRHAAADSAR